MTKEILERKHKLQNERFDNESALELLLDADETLSCLDITDFLRNKYKYVGLIIEHCKELEINADNLEKTYNEAIDNCNKYNGEPMYKELKYYTKIGRNKEESNIIGTLHQKVIDELIALSNSIDDNMKVEIEEHKRLVERYFDLNIEMLDNQSEFYSK